MSNEGLIVHFSEQLDESRREWRRGRPELLHIPREAAFPLTDTVFEQVLAIFELCHNGAHSFQKRRFRREDRYVGWFPGSQVVMTLFLLECWLLAMKLCF